MIIRPETLPFLIAKLQCVVLDCADVAELSRFYQSLLGGVVNQPDPLWSLGDGWATLHTDGHVLAFQRVEDHQPPRWPDPARPQPFHLDLGVKDLDRAQEDVLNLGASLLDEGASVSSGTDRRHRKGAATVDHRELCGLTMRRWPQATALDPARWREAFEVAMSRIAGRFSRYEPRLRAGRLVLGLLSDLPRKNCWTIAEWAGEASPHGMQHLLCRASWDADAVRDDVREYVVEHLHDEAAVLVVDETGDVKKGTPTVGVQRQYTGTAGRIENSQVAVYLVYAGARGHAAVDRELYIPRSWTCDPDRCRAAGLGENTVFATKPELARTMIERFLDAGHHVGWVTGDEVYGGNPKLRTALEERGIGYVLAVACSAEVTTGAGTFRADALVKKVPKRAWQKLSAGRGAKGQRFYDWAVIDLTEAAPGSRQLLIRRNRTTGELAYYRCSSPQPVPLTELVRIAGSRWRVEETFQSEKGLAGLDEHQVRRYHSWTRWVTLAMLAHAFLAVVRADEHARNPAPDALVPLSCNEIQRLFITRVVQPLHDIAHRLGWSDWRRRHQQRSRTSHYQRQAASQT